MNENKCETAEPKVQDDQEDHPEVPHQGDGVDEEEGNEEEKLQAWVISESNEE